MDYIRELAKADMIPDILSSGDCKYTQSQLERMPDYEVFQLYSQAWRKKSGLKTHVLYASAEEDNLIFIQFKDESDAEIVHRFLKEVSDLMDEEGVRAWSAGRWRLISPTDDDYNEAVDECLGCTYRISAKN